MSHLTELSPNLFDFIPTRFFQPLAAPSQRIYATTLMHLYRLAQIEFVLSEESAVNGVISVVAEAAQAEQELLTQDAVVQSELRLLEKFSLPNDLSELEETYQRQRLQARAILRYLIATGWLVTEQQPNGAYHYTFPSYTFSFFRTFQEITERRATEFEGMIYGIYAMLKEADEAQVSPYALIQQVHSQTQQIIDGLKQLHDNIKGYLEQLISDVDANEILRHFSTYQGLITPAYHRLKTADHVARYRHEIQQKVSAYLRDTQWVQRVGQELQRRQPQFSTEEAEQTIRQQLTYIEAQFGELDDFIKKIDDRHRLYADNLVSQVKYRLQGRQDNKGKLVSLLESLKECPRRSVEMLTPLFSMFDVAYLDQNSMRRPAKEQKAYQPIALPPSQMETADWEAIQEKLERDIKNMITPERVWAYLSPHLENQPRVESSQLPLETMEDWLMLIGLRVYADVADSPYRCLEPPTDHFWVERQTDLGIFQCHNLQFERRPHG